MLIVSMFLLDSESGFFYFAFPNTVIYITVSLYMQNKTQTAIKKVLEETAEEQELQKQRY
jgi:hypothetical protein